MIYLLLFLVFAKIGLFAFGGGYANLAIIESELLSHQWCSSEKFADICAVAQLTPGPIVINTATYVGKEVAGIPGGICATLGFVFPAVLLSAAICLLSRYLAGNRAVASGIRGIRAGVMGLVIYAVIFFMENSVLDRGLELNRLLYDFQGTVNGWKSVRLVIPALIIFAINLIFIKKFKLSIYLSLVISVILGMSLMYFYYIIF